jgi:hypothetical protein
MRALLIIGLLLTKLAIAAPMLPKHCSAIAVQGELLKLQSKKRTLVFIHNTTTMDLWITHLAEKAEVPGDWTSKLQANHWSAIVVPKGSFSLQCIESRPGHEQQVPCEGVIGACRWKKAKIPPGNEAVIGEDMGLAALEAVIGGKAVVLP